MRLTLLHDGTEEDVPAYVDPPVENEVDIPETLVVVDGTVVAATSHIDMAAGRGR